MKARLPKDWSQNELKRLEAGAKMKASAGEIEKDECPPVHGGGLLR